MEVTPAQRLKEFLNYKKISFNEFARLINSPKLMNQSDKYVGEGKKSTLKITYQEKFSVIGLNYYWYLTGQGEMLLSKPEKKNIGINNKGKGVPFYNIDITASYLESFNDVPEIPEFYIDFKPLNDCDAFMPVFGDSMYPKYASGDIVAIKRFRNYEVILWGEVYLVITDATTNNLRTIKSIYPHTDQDKIILRAINPLYSGDIVIPKSSIINLFIIKGRTTINQM